MRVMVIVNGDTYCNGSQGTVVALDEHSVDVQLDSGERRVFTKRRFDVEGNNSSHKTASVQQIPLIPANAITIHKSQGQTFDQINVDCAGSWETGQLYVAMSRARRIEGIYLRSPILPYHIKTNRDVVRFYQDLSSMAA